MLNTVAELAVEKQFKRPGPATCSAEDLLKQLTQAWSDYATAIAAQSETQILSSATGIESASFLAPARRAAT